MLINRQNHYQMTPFFSQAAAAAAAISALGEGSSMEPRNGLAPGDYVTCSVDLETVKLMQEEYGGWNDRMRGIIGNTSIVKGHTTKILLLQKIDF